MTEEILERAKAVVGKCHLVRETELLLPELIAEVERLRADQDAIMAAWDKDAVEHDARIKELEAAVVDGRAQYLLFLDRNPGCTAWNFDEMSGEDQNTLREQARISLEMEEPLVMIQLREARERIKELEEANRNIDKRRDEMAAFIERLEAAFLKAESQRLWDLGKSTGKTSYDCQEAREALEEIKTGGKDED